MSVERQVQHSVDEEATSEDLPATPDEMKENRINLGKIRRATVRENVMRLPVSIVTTAKNSPNWVVEVDHPIQGDLRLFVEAPTHGWNDENELVRLLDWYGCADDPYELQTRHVFVEYVGEEADRTHGWKLIKPPHYKDPITDRVKSRVTDFNLSFKIPYDFGTMMLFKMVIGGSVVAPMLYRDSYGILEIMITNALVLLALLILWLAITEEEK